MQEYSRADGGPRTKSPGWDGLNDDQPHRAVAPIRQRFTRRSMNPRVCDYDAENGAPVLTS